MMTEHREQPSHRPEQHYRPIYGLPFYKLHKKL